MREARLIVGMVAGLLMAGCGEGGGGAPGESGVPEDQRRGGVAVVASLSEASSLNHFASIDDISNELQTFALFTTLIRYDAELQPQPYLATSWDTASSGDALRLTFHLRDDVRWHDGAPTTAYDVKFTFDRIKDPQTAYPQASRLALYDSAVVQDSFTVTLHLKRHPGFLDPWRLIPPMPVHLLGDVPATELKQHLFGSTSPVGNGPFRFVEHRAGDRWVFEANGEFPPGLGGRPHLDRLIYRHIAEPTTRLAEFLTGEVDVYLIVAPSQVPEIVTRPGAQVITYPTRSYTFINWNGRKPLFRDPAVRRALTLAIDRRSIVENVQRGLGQVAKGPIPPFHWAFDAELEPLPYDPDSAAALLDAAGWVDRDGDGIRERDGLKLSFELRTNPNPAREDIMTLVQADLAKVGVEVRTQVQEAQSLGRDIISPERRFDALVLGWGTQFNIDDRPLFACSQLESAFQWAGYCNPRVDSLLNRVTQTVDRAVSGPLWREYQQIMIQDQPYTFLYYDVRANAVRKRVRDVRMDIRGDFVNVKDWWIDPADRRR